MEHKTLPVYFWLPSVAQMMKLTIQLSLQKGGTGYFLA